MYTHTVTSVFINNCHNPKIVGYEFHLMEAHQEGLRIDIDMLIQIHGMIPSMFTCMETIEYRDPRVH